MNTNEDQRAFVPLLIRDEGLPALPRTCLLLIPDRLTHLLLRVDRYH